MVEDGDTNRTEPVPEDDTMGAEELDTPPIWKPALKEAGCAFVAASYLCASITLTLA